MALIWFQSRLTCCCGSPQTLATSGVCLPDAPPLCLYWSAPSTVPPPPGWKFHGVPDPGNKWRWWGNVYHVSYGSWTKQEQHYLLTWFKDRSRNALHADNYTPAGGAVAQRQHWCPIPYRGLVPTRNHTIQGSSTHEEPGLVPARRHFSHPLPISSLISCLLFTVLLNKG